MEYLTLLQKLEDYYANLLIVQYNGKPKATETIKLLVNLVYVNMILMQIRDSFNWVTAEGEQLDIIGKWVGVSRDYIGSDIWGKKFYSYPTYNKLVPDDLTNDDLQHGFSDYSTYDTDTGYVLTYADLKTTGANLKDDDYRIVIGLKIIKNSINHTAGEIDKAIWEYFGGDVYTTWQPHEVIYHYPSSLTSIMNICKDKNVLPAPTGCKITI